jgi:hypothetical protein
LKEESVEWKERVSTEGRLVKLTGAIEEIKEFLK